MEDHPIVRWTERGALLLLVFYLFLHTMPRAWNSLVTDFPNYYMSAQLAHEGYDTSRMYEWDWLQREKDHRAVDVRVIGLLPITPFSTLAFFPLTGLAPLAAKHVWIAINLGLLLPIIWMIRSMTGLPYRRIALLFALSFPLHTNLLFGQFYIVLLLLLVAACWVYLRGSHGWAGALIAVAAACKIFPAIFLYFFSTTQGVARPARRRRHWTTRRRSLHRGLWLERTSHVSARDSSLGPARRRPAALSGRPFLLQRAALIYFCSSRSGTRIPGTILPQLRSTAPTLQMLALAPAILLIRREDTSRDRVLLNGRRS